MDTESALDYIQEVCMWVESTSLDTFEQNPNEVFTPHQVEYYKLILPYIYMMEFHFMLLKGEEKVEHYVRNGRGPQSVHILLFIIGN